MNHKIPVDWLFEDAEELSQQQFKDLQEHLVDCESCQALAESFQQMQMAFKRAELVAPKAGFALRWQARLQTSREKAYRRQILTLLTFALVGILALTILFLFLAWPWLRAPNLLLWTWVYQWFSLFTYAHALRLVLTPVIREVFILVPLAAWVFSLGLLSEMAVLWVVSYQLLTNPRRITK